MRCARYRRPVAAAFSALFISDRQQRLSLGRTHSGTATACSGGMTVHAAPVAEDSATSMVESMLHWGFVGAAASVLMLGARRAQSSPSPSSVASRFVQGDEYLAAADVEVARSVGEVDNEPRISWNVYGAARDLVGRVAASNGVEGVRRGHVLVIGDVEQVLASGHLKGHNDFSDPDMQGIAIEDSVGAEAVRCRMNAGCMTIIDGVTGIVHVNNFFANRAPSSSVSRSLDEGKVGSETDEALRLSRTCSQCVIFTISTDGRVTEYQNGHSVEVDPMASPHEDHREIGY